LTDFLVEDRWMRKLLVKALVVLAMGLYSLSTAPDASAASGNPSCGLNPPCGSAQSNLEFCLTNCGTPYWSCTNDPYQPYGTYRLYCYTGADD